MNSQEQPGATPEQSTTESMEDITLERREWYGLGEPRELTDDELKKIEASIKELLMELAQYNSNFNDYGPEIQEEWYWAEQEAMAGRDRELAEAVLKNLFEVLQRESF